MNFSFRKGELEVRSCNDMLTSEGEHTRAEIVKWEHVSMVDRDCCYTLASFDNDGDLRFVGGRPFKLDDYDDFMMLARIGCDCLVVWNELKDDD